SLPRAHPPPIPVGRVTPACHERWCRGAPERSLGTRYTGTAARGHHWDGHWHADCPILTSRDSDSRHGDRSAWRCPPCGDGGGLGASARVALEVALGVVYLYLAGNSERPRIRYNTSFLYLWVVYLSPADNYHRFTWPTFTGAKRPR